MLQEAPSTNKTPEEVQDQVARITTKLAERAEQNTNKPADTYDRAGVTGLVRQEADGATTTSVAAGDVFKDGLSGATLKESDAQSHIELSSIQSDGSGAVLKLETGSPPQLEQFKSDGSSEQTQAASVPEIISMSAPILEDIRSKTEPAKVVTSNVQQFPSSAPDSQQKAA